jgi:hypothetical protein
MMESLIDPRTEPLDGLEAESIFLYHISISAYPIPEPDLVRLKDFMNQFISGIADKYRLTPEYFVQTEQVITEEWAGLLSKHASYWNVKTGLGMRSDRPSFKIEEALLKIFTNSPGPALGAMKLVYHLGRDEHFERFYAGMKWPSAIDVYLGSGAVIICMVSDGEKFLERTRQFYLKDLDAALQNLDFYFPIISQEDFGKASKYLAHTWFGFFDVYIAETKSDPGILIASRHNLDDLLAEFQSVLESENKRDSR